MDFPSVFKRSVERTPDREALVDIESGERYSYRETAERAYAVANGLQELGVEQGDRVAICASNRCETALTILATQLMGAVAVPFNFRLPANQIRYHVEDSAPTAFVFGPTVEETVTTIQNEVDPSLVSIDEKTAVNSATPFEALLDSPADDPEYKPDPDDTSVILYTSGTTGAPKGVPLTHQMGTGRIMSNSLALRLYLGERVLGVVPLYHAIGFHYVFCTALGLSGTYVAMPSFDPAAFVSTVEEESITWLYAVPTMFRTGIQSGVAEETNLDTVRVIAYGGSPMGQSLIDDVKMTFDPAHMRHIYGSTETGDPLANVDSVETGPSNVFYRTRIVEIGAKDPTAEVDQGDEGELIVHTESPEVFNSYWNKPAETDRAIVDGWFFTDDAAHRTAEGNTIVTGRADDIIISGGENIHPSEVEDVLMGHGGVADAGVIGVPDDEWGEQVKAYIPRAEDASVTEGDLDDWCRESEDLADFKRPRAYVFVDEIPRNPSGKVMRYKLKDLEKA